MNRPTTPAHVFAHLVVLMGHDNGCHFTNTPEDAEAALPHIEALMAAGYFLDDPEKLEDSFWEMAAGEDSEQKVYFSRAPEAHAALNAILNKIFDGPIEEDA